MLTFKRVAVVGSRKFTNYEQLSRELRSRLEPEDWIVSGGALGADSMAQRYAKEHGGTILIFYPDWRPKGVYNPGAGFLRNKAIVENSDIILAFYEKGRFQQGGTFNTATWARKLGKELVEFEQE